MTNHFRIGTINDKNVNYVSFTFKVDSSNDFAFDQVPTIKIDGTAVNDNLVRVGIGVNGEFRIYGKTAATENVVSAADGTLGPMQVRAFSDYTKGYKRVLSTSDSTFVTVNIWVQDPLFASKDTTDPSENKRTSYDNKVVTIENFKLVPVHPFTATAVYMVDSVKTVGGFGGTVAINNGEFSDVATAYVATGQTITLKASPNTTNGYDLVKWSKTEAGSDDLGKGTQTDMVYALQYTVASENQVYAHFSDEHVLYLILFLNKSL